MVYPEVEWLAPGELQADALGDLRTQDNTLSVFELDGVVTPARIAIAVAAGKPNLDNTGYAVFDRAGVEAVDIQIERIPGTTPDAVVNALHYNLRVGTGTVLLKLAGVIAESEMAPILRKKVKELLKAGMDSGQLGASVNKDLRERL